MQRHLNNEPVTARPPSKLYEFQKTVRRHKVGFAATAAVMLALALGLSVSVWSLVEERQERQRAVTALSKAQTESAKSRQVAQFLEDMLDGVGPSVALGRDTAMLREILDKTAARLDKDLRDQPEVEAQLRTTIGQVYTDLGDYGKAIEMQRAALAIQQKLFGDGNLAYG